MTDPEDRTSAPAGDPSPADTPPEPPPVTGPERPGQSGVTGPGPVPAAGGGTDAESPAVPAPSSGAAVVPSPTTEVEPAPPTEVEPVSAEMEPVTPPAKAAVTDTPPARPPRPDFEEEDEDDTDGAATDDLEPIPRWVALVNTLGVGLIVVMAAWTIAAIVQGLYYPGNEGQGITNDVLHRLGTPFVPTHWVLVMVTLMIAVLLLSLPVLLEEDVTYGQERAASIALLVVVVLAVIVCLGAILSVRSALHAVTAQGQTVPSFYRVDRTAYLLAVLGTGLLAAYSAIVARGMRYGTD